MTIDPGLVAVVAARYSLSPGLLQAQIIVESSGMADAFRWEPAYYTRYIRNNPQAKAARFGPLAACSFGPLQILLETACELGFSGLPWDLFDPAIGLDWGAHYLAQLLAWAKGDYHQSLAAFNGGKSGNAKPPFRNEAYAQRVFSVYQAAERTHS
jgi:hypothetical protein